MVGVPLGSLGPLLGRAETLEAQHHRLKEHLAKLQQSKIDLTADRFQWLQWYQDHAGLGSPSCSTTTPSLPSLLILHCCCTCPCPHDHALIPKLLSHAFRVREVWQEEVGEDVAKLKKLLKHGIPRLAESECSSLAAASEELAIQGIRECDRIPLQPSDSSTPDGNKPARFSWGFSNSSAGSSSGSPSAGNSSSPDGDAPDAVVLVCGREGRVDSSVTTFLEVAIGTVFLQGNAVLVLAEDAEEEERARLHGWSAATWPVFSCQQKLFDFVEHELFYRLHLRRLIHGNIHQLLSRHKEVNLTWYALSRGAMALVPFGVHALNAVSLVDLCRQCMVDAGMAADQQAQKAMAKDAGKAGVVEFAANSASDVYELLVKGAILTEMIEAGSLSAAIATLDLADACLLGSISVVTGAVAAITAYVSRPRLVDSLADVMVMLQFTYYINPDLRRGWGGPEATAADDAGNQLHAAQLCEAGDLKSS